VKRYVHEKISYIQTKSPDDEHILVIPGPTSEVVTGERSRIYSIHSPLVSRSSRYRALLDLRAVGEILERERPDLIESGDPYQVGWKAIAIGRSLRVPVVGFYHSHPDDRAVPSKYDLDHAWPTYSYVVVSVEKGQAVDLRSWEMEPDRSRFNQEEITETSRAVSDKR